MTDGQSNLIFFFFGADIVSLPVQQRPDCKESDDGQGYTPYADLPSANFDRDITHRRPDQQTQHGVHSQSNPKTFILFHLSVLALKLELMTGTKKTEPVTAFLVAATLSLPQRLPRECSFRTPLRFVATELHQPFFKRTLSKLELMTGIEPVTSPLPRECSTN